MAGLKNLFSGKNSFLSQIMGNNSSPGWNEENDPWSHVNRNNQQQPADAQNGANTNNEVYSPVSNHSRNQEIPYGPAASGYQTGPNNYSPYVNVDSEGQAPATYQNRNYLGQGFDQGSLEGWINPQTGQQGTPEEYEALIKSRQENYGFNNPAAVDPNSLQGIAEQKERDDALAAGNIQNQNQFNIQQGQMNNEFSDPGANQNIQGTFDSSSAHQLFQKLNDGSISPDEMAELNRIKQNNPEILKQLNQSWKPTGPMGAPDNPPSQGLNDYDPAFHPTGSTGTDVDSRLGGGQFDPGNVTPNHLYGGRRGTSSWDNLKGDVSKAFGQTSNTTPGAVQGPQTQFNTAQSDLNANPYPGRDASFLDASNLAKKYSDSYQQSVTKDVYGEPVGGYGGESSDYDYDTDYSGETIGALPAGTSLGNSSQFGYGQQGGPVAPIHKGDPRIDAAQDSNSIMNQLNNAGSSGDIQNLISPHSENYKVNLGSSGEKMNLLDDAWNREQSNTVSNDVFQPDATATEHPTESEIGHAIGRDASPYENMIGLAGNMTDGNSDQIKEMMNRIAWHESGMTMDPNQLQGGGGPGRGMYQFEGQSLPTAVNRSINAYTASGQEVPSWLQDINDQGITDATQLTPEVQSALALGNILSQSGSTNSLNQYFGGEGDISDLWADYHWQGDTADRNKRVESFNSHNRLYDGQGFESSGKGYQFP